MKTEAVGNPIIATTNLLAARGVRYAQRVHLSLAVAVLTRRDGTEVPLVYDCEYGDGCGSAFVDGWFADIQKKMNPGEKLRRVNLSVPWLVASAHVENAEKTRKREPAVRRQIEFDS